MFDARGIRIFVGFDFHNVDALRLESIYNLSLLLLCEAFIVSVYVFDVICHVRDV